MDALGGTPGLEAISKTMGLDGATAGLCHVLFQFCAIRTNGLTDNFFKNIVYDPNGHGHVRCYINGKYWSHNSHEFCLMFTHYILKWYYISS